MLWLKKASVKHVYGIIGACAYEKMHAEVSMYRLVVFGAQVQCENASDVLALIRAAQKTVATKTGTDATNTAPRVHRGFCKKR